MTQIVNASRLFTGYWNVPIKAAFCPNRRTLFPNSRIWVQTVDEDGFINFTDKGEEHAKAIYERHNVLTAVFEKLGVDPKIAEEDACKIEHVISDETFEAVKKHYGYK